MSARTTIDHPGKASLLAIMEATGRATPGPWHRSGWLVETENAGSTSYQAVAVCFGEWSSGTAAFIATARNNIASVAALVASLEAERDAAKAENDRLREIASKIVAVGNMVRKASSVIATMMLADAVDDARTALGGNAR